MIGRLSRWLALSFVPALIGLPFPAPEWYRGLRRPSWSPPPAVFGPVWTALYTSMGIAAALVSARPASDERDRALSLFKIQLALNAAWTPIFFGLRRPGVALAEIVAMWLAVAATVALFARQRLAAGLLLLPYLAWVTFATALNAAIWHRNRELG